MDCDFCPLSQQPPPPRGRLGKGLACSACILSTGLLRGHQHAPPLPALQLHPRETPSRARPREAPTQPHPPLLFVGLLIHPPTVGGLPNHSQRLQGPGQELRARLSGWGLGSELWQLGQGLLGQRQAGRRLAGATPPLLPALGSSVWATDEPAFKGRACQEGGALSPPPQP